MSYTFTYIVLPDVTIKKTDDLIMYDSIIDLNIYDRVTFYFKRNTNSYDNDYQATVFDRFGTFIAQNHFRIDNSSINKLVVQLPIDKKRIKSGIYYLIVSLEHGNNYQQPLKYVKKFIIKK